MEATFSNVFSCFLLLGIVLLVKPTRQGYLVPDQPCQHCGPETFACGNSNGQANNTVNCTCIPIRWRCDGDVDCINDSSDEVGCALESCSSEHFTCLNGKCILRSWWCDGDNDCGDGSDEDDCTARECQPDKEFKCGNDRCVRLDWHCDGSDDCGDGSDEECPGRPCAASEFRCHSGGCISLSWHCDHDTDCADGSDELDCELMPVDVVSCRTGQHRCRNGRCIAEAYRCDGDNDCGDWSDEEKCEGRVECRASEFRCLDGQCINVDWRCDGDADCDDRSDEQDCPSKTCSPDEFRCRSGRCIKSIWRCDGDVDCSDNSDEDGCGLKLECTTGNFRCGDGTCISQALVCDGAPNCPDGSDEDLNGTCASTTPCREDGFPCQHLCIATANGHHCACKDGYQMGSDGRSCIDIDECSLKEQTCSQKCENSVPGYQCSCAKGYRLRNDKRRCKALGPEPVVVFANRVDIRRVSLDKSEYTAVLSGLQNAIAIDYHYQMNMIFWSDITADAIFSASLNGTHITTVVNAGLVSPGGIAVDWIGDRIFWTDSGTSRIEFANLNGAMRKVLFWKGLEKPRAVVVNPEESCIYWTDWGQQPKIEKAFMDGTGRRTVIETSLFWPNGITIDHPSERIYWVDAKHHVIESANLDGSDRKRVVEGDLPHPFSVTVFEDSLYWTDWHTKSIHTASKLTGRNITMVHNKLHFPMDITILHPLRQMEVLNRCAGHSCSHICLPNNESYKCTCPTGYHISGDLVTCKDQPDTFLLFTRRSDIRWLCIDCPEDANIDVVLPLKSINSVVSIDYDQLSSMIFWSDVANKTISRGFWNGTHQEVVVSTSLESPAGLAIDWACRNIYWVDAGRNTIEVSRIDGTKRTILLWKSLNQPRDIVIDPTTQLMFFSHWDSATSKIERSGMDGSSRTVLHSFNITWAYGLALDFQDKKLYWSDASWKRIEYSDFDGSNRRVLVSRNLKHPYGLVVYQEHVYWTDLELKSIQRIHKVTGEDRKTLIAGLDNLMDIQMFNNQQTTTMMRLAKDNGCTKSGCSHICLLSPSSPGYRCTCPTGIVLLDDYKTCADDMQRYLIVATRTSIRRISLEVPYFSDVVIPISQNMSNAIILDVHPLNRTVYWSDTNDDKIYRATLDGRRVEPIITAGLDDVNGLAIDSVGNKIYWTNAGLKRIEVANLDGSQRKVLIWHDLDSPRGIAVHYASGYMIWIDWGAVVRIERADMDGGRRAVIIKDKLGWPNGITVMSRLGRIVWVDSQRHTIEMADLNGANRHVLAEDVPSPYGVAVVDNHVYWTDWETRAIHRMQISSTYSVDVDVVKSKPELVLGGLNNLVDLRAVVEPAPDFFAQNMCQINNGGCSHLCLRNSAKGYSCHCPTGIRLFGDEKTCQMNMSKFLLLACKTSVRRVSLDTPDHSDVHIPLQNAVNVVSIDYDYSTSKLFFTDHDLRVIRSASFDGHNEVTVINNDLTTPDGLAVDWIAKNLYWTDIGRNVIEVSRVDGSCRKIIVDLGLDEPRAIALIPDKGYLFWSDTGSAAKIERAFLDGSSRKAIISSELGWPNGLVVDEMGERIYWTDAQLDRIESADIDGKFRGIVIKQVTNPYGITVIDEHIYWSDWQTKAVERANKITGGELETIVDNIELLMEIKMVSATRQNGFNPCANHNGACTHLCLFRPKGYICACPSYPDPRPCSTVPGEIPDVTSAKPEVIGDKEEAPPTEPTQHINKTICKDQENHPNCEASKPSLDDQLIQFALMAGTITILCTFLIILTLVILRRKAHLNSTARNDDFANPAFATATSRKQAKSQAKKGYDKGRAIEDHDNYLPPPPPPPSHGPPRRFMMNHDEYRPTAIKGQWLSPLEMMKNPSTQSIETDI